MRLHLLDHDGRAGATRQFHNQLGQGDAADGNRLTGDAGKGSVDENTIVVNNFHNDGELAAVRAVVDKDQATDFNEARVYLHAKRGLEMDGQVPFGFYGQVTEPTTPVIRLYIPPHPYTTMRSCTNCRRAHIKCDGVRPSCETCLVKGKRCSYRGDVEGTGNRAPRLRGPTTQTKALQKLPENDLYFMEKDLLTPQIERLLHEYPDSKFLDAIHASVTNHLEYMGEAVHYYKFEPSALLAFGLLAQELVEPCQVEVSSEEEGA